MSCSWAYMRITISSMGRRAWEGIYPVSRVFRSIARVAINHKPYILWAIVSSVHVSQCDNIHTHGILSVQFLEWKPMQEPLKVGPLHGRPLLRLARVIVFLKKTKPADACDLLESFFHRLAGLGRSSRTIFQVCLQKILTATHIRV